MQRKIDIIFNDNGLVRRGLTGFVVSLFISTIAVLVMDARAQMARLETASSDNIQWVLSQTETEIVGLKIAMYEARLAETLDLDELRLRFDIFYSRIETLKNSPVFDEMRQDPEVRSALTEIEAFLAEWVPAIDSPDPQFRAVLPEFAVDIDAAHRTSREMALAGIEFFSRTSDLRRTSVSRTLFNIAVLTVALVVLLLMVAIALLRLARQRERSATENRLTRERMETIISTSLDAVIVTNRSGVIEEYNGAAERIFGYSRDEAIGQQMADLIIPPQFRDMHHAGMKRYTEHGEARLIGKGIAQLEATGKDGKLFPVDISLASAQSPGGEIFIGFMRDISDRVQAEQALKRARDRAIEGEKHKAELLAVMSHEMRTPLNGLLGTLDLFETDSLNPKQRRHLRIIRNSGKLLLAHVNDVLDISRLDAGKMSMRKTRFDLIALLTEIIESQSGRAAQNGNRLVLSPPSPALHEVYSDPDRIRQIMLNLVGNAIKFTKDGTITIEAECQNGLNEVELRVIDTGVGIEEADLERIFGDFVTIDNSYGRSNTGTGLGLGISSRLASALGGMLGAESEPGDGSLFWMRLPLAPAPGETPQIDSAAPTPDPDLEIDLPPLQILMVEDNEVNRMVAREMLERLGHSVTEAYDGAEGVERANREEYDLILMDISMPGMDGLTAARLIRSGDGPSADVPIIATTAHALPEEVVAFRAAGMNDVLIKPINGAAIRRVLGSVFMEFAQDAQADDDPGAPVPLLNHTHLAELSADLPSDRLEAALRTFATEMTTFVAEIRLMLETDADRAAMAAEAHRMAGSAGVFGAERLTELLRELQTMAPDAPLDALLAKRRELNALWPETLSEIERSGHVSLANLEAP
ncbi:PAS domain-containing hybrid sensor histidine kinase/response regulator [Tropicibacter naphthalenivorans]|uniref:histidine kinase n=1 Tax=Tropicibacter naphthalenivorans TaxID=441103 RepID=A0A0P1G244_9RHOB|nr:PAS domain-containing hybrid sensor histidine kinase/response regulator [Tropicibacter naphthalenivorans]CUH75682.1 Aerobic respiration control sensor protein ArcB [Tropicibacter naphthalenivorans]SMC42830.1 PAS/PAC sensor hybrid histidine kinase [Tropicibacter naphthalenivorans]